MLAGCLLAISLTPPAAAAVALRPARGSSPFRAVLKCTEDYVPFEGRRKSYVPSWVQQGSDGTKGSATNVYREMQSEYEQYAEQTKELKADASVEHASMPSPTPDPHSTFSLHFVESQAEFESLLADNADRTTVVDFTARWCGPCQLIAPAVAAMAREFPDAVFVKVDVDVNPETVRACQVSGFPTFKIYRQQAERAMVPGANEATLRAAVRAVELNEMSFGGEGSSNAAAPATSDASAKYCKYDAIRAQLAESRARSYAQGRQGCCGKAGAYLTEGSSGPPPGSPWSR